MAPRPGRGCDPKARCTTAKLEAGSSVLRKSEVSAQADLPQKCDHPVQPKKLTNYGMDGADPKAGPSCRPSLSPGGTAWPRGTCWQEVFFSSELRRLGSYPWPMLPLPTQRSRREKGGAPLAWRSASLSSAPVYWGPAVGCGTLLPRGLIAMGPRDVHTPCYSVTPAWGNVSQLFFLRPVGRARWTGRAQGLWLLSCAQGSPCLGSLGAEEATSESAEVGASSRSRHHEGAGSEDLGWEAQLPAPSPSLCPPTLQPAPQSRGLRPTPTCSSSSPEPTHWLAVTARIERAVMSS